MPGVPTDTSVLDLEVSTLHGKVLFGVALATTRQPVLYQVEWFLRVFAGSVGLRALTTSPFCPLEFRGEERYREVLGLECLLTQKTSGVMPPLMISIARAGR